MGVLFSAYLQCPCAFAYSRFKADCPFSSFIFPNFVFEVGAFPRSKD